MSNFSLCGFIYMGMVFYSLANDRLVIGQENITKLTTANSTNSSKWVSFIHKLDTIDPKLRETALEKLRSAKNPVLLVKDVVNNASPEEVKSFFFSIIDLYWNHPGNRTAVIEGFQRIVSGQGSFNEVDKKFEKIEEWNTYWNTWFRMVGDYVARYG